MAEKKPKKTKVYQCLFFEKWYDDLGRGFLCHHPRACGECLCKKLAKSIYSQQMCPHYKKGVHAGTWVVTKDMKADAKGFVEKLRNRRWAS